MKKEAKIQVGAILGAHGVQGEVRLRSFTTDPEAIFAFKKLSGEDGKQAFEPKRKGAMKGDFIVSLKGVTDRNGAEALRGTKLFVARSALPKAGKNEYYEADLAGLAARGEDGKSCGTVLALHDYGAGAFLEIQPLSGASFMLPFTDDYVPEVDLAAGCLTVVVPEGWLAAEKPEGKKKG
ncbi:MAG: ribosome maturation factor RimM [Alphaproteobacteria bacterium]|nr:ribosome maturation factor RimM [Alphaproteobacteria bacterium]